MSRSRRARLSNSLSSLRSPKIRKRRYNTRSQARRKAALGRDQEGRTNWLSEEEHRRRLNILNPILDGPGSALVIQNINFNKLKNGLDHHTLDYDISDLVVRRGQAFTLTIKFDRDVNVENDQVVLQFCFGSHPQESKGTLIRLKLNLKERIPVSSVSYEKWIAVAQASKGSSLSVTVTPSADALVGRHELFVETSFKEDNSSLRRFELENEEVYIIFNPWCGDDVVYMENEDERFEYVLNDHGRIWVGSANNNHGRPWNYGQFESPVLEATLFLIDKAEVGDSARRSPISFVRAIAALANSNDDNGVLEGRWTETYPKHCTPPAAWTGSVRILEEFMFHKKPVKYGQCWVFSGLVTSLLRSVGIPTRSVTNFESAHDTDSSMTLDFHFDENNMPMSWMNDSIWNFHVWNESYFRRLDLPQGYDGWQAHDATPQELSEGVARCGPAPIRAIKEGHVYLNYDVPFIFCEVNGDRVMWQVGENGEMQAIDIDTHAVGKLICTKAISGNLRHDLTLDYKYPEGSPEERRVVESVYHFGRRAEYEIYRKTARDVEFKIVVPTEVDLGKSFKLLVQAMNKSERKRSVHGCVTVCSSYYTGIPGKNVKGQTYDADLAPGEERDLSLDIASTDYLHKLNPEASMQAYILFIVKETHQQFARATSFILNKPVLKFEIPDVIKEKEEVTGVVSFTNPLAINLTSASLSLEGASAMLAVFHSFSKPVKAGEEVRYTFTICPQREGVREIVAAFSSDQLSGVDGFVEFNVQPADSGC